MIDLRTADVHKLKLQPASTGAAGALLKFAMSKTPPLTSPSLLRVPSYSHRSCLLSDNAIGLVRESASAGIVLSLYIASSGAFVHVQVKLHEVELTSLLNA